MNDIDSAMCQRVRALGFSGIFTRFRDNDPLTTPRADAERLKSLLSGEGVQLFQTTGYWQNLVTSDEAARAQSVRVLQAALKLAGWMGARGIDTGPGSMNPAGPWFPHPDNWTARAEAQLIRSLKECAKAAEDAGVFLSLESHSLVTPRTPEIAARILDAVDSPWVRCDYDSANWITLETIYDTTAALNHHFDVLGDHICSAHAKDIWVENRLAIHLQDGCPGKGLMDFETLFTRLEGLDPDYPMIAEGNSTEELPEVSALFHATARKLGIRVLDTGERAEIAK
ncbi:sugar phosphate isomerase/epimerase family protein [Devosia sp.]|uniref:sugar phosphate isomerase/epimerase family protein n=1 Tax=Devosia sp. TaxID=1871048 RepID=UPI001AC9014D|nr:sugar phosphate isomerase/epimerase family protein [Devosia sp.]MBN9309332.1 sugar phosphate isomerase/epimerase [Devosia sp.]